MKKLEERYVYTELGENVPKLLKDMKKHPIKTLRAIQGLVSGIQTNEKSRDVIYDKDTLKRLTEYKERIASKGITYLSTGSDELDALTFGFHRNDLWTFGGRGGVGKTWLMVCLAHLCELRMSPELGPVLFLTSEIPASEIQERFDCIRFQLDYEKFQRGSLSKAQFSRYRKGLKKLEATGSRVVITEDCQTLDDLEAKIHLYRPAIVFVDGSYLLEPQMEEGIAKTTYITRNLKSKAKSHTIPIINSTQLRKKSGRKTKGDRFEGQDEFYYGSYVQDSDFAARMYQDVDMVYHSQVGIQFVKGRRIPPGSEITWQAQIASSQYKFMLKEEEEEEAEIAPAGSDEEIDF